ncbi:hypothetical protein PIROE2DRAFT_62121 [Piromyces sp. E2]|nr:hypothetical protein PIROE2DRAFT_62121 [Piromyces sp. E2]|eukprot:OUM62079.1 hypothetical protein PIROE2DRAFT_62121 [Piromyces sp. E2]
MKLIFNELVTVLTFVVNVCYALTTKTIKGTTTKIIPNSNSEPSSKTNSLSSDTVGSYVTSVKAIYDRFSHPTNYYKVMTLPDTVADAQVECYNTFYYPKNIPQVPDTIDNYTLYESDLDSSTMCFTYTHPFPYTTIKNYSTTTGRYEKDLTTVTYTATLGTKLYKITDSHYHYTYKAYDEILHDTVVLTERNQLSKGPSTRIGCTRLVKYEKKIPYISTITVTPITKYYKVKNGYETVTITKNSKVVTTSLASYATISIISSETYYSTYTQGYFTSTSCDLHTLTPTPTPTDIPVDIPNEPYPSTPKKIPNYTYTYSLNTKKIPTSNDISNHLPTSTRTTKQLPTSTNTTKQFPTSTNTTKQLPTSTNINKKVINNMATFKQIPISIKTTKQIPISIKTTKQIPISTNTIRKEKLIINNEFVKKN